MKYSAAILLSSICLLAIGSPAYSQEIRLDLGSVISNIVSPPHRQTEINARAEIEKERLRQQAGIEQAKIAAEASKNLDRVSPILTRWGVNQVNCAPGGTFINGLSVDTICINPTAAIPAGYYNYSADRQLLVRVETKAAPTSIPAPVVAKNANSTATVFAKEDRGF